MPGDLEQLARLLDRRAEFDQQIAGLIRRPALLGNIGEFIASRIFDIQLVESGAQPGYDGVFRSGPLAEHTVNVKTYAEQAYILDISQHPCDYYLVLSGPPRPAGQHDTPWRLHAVYLLRRDQLLSELGERGVKVGVATSVRQDLWETREIYPPSERSRLALNARQRRLLGLFRGEDDP